MCKEELAVPLNILWRKSLDTGIIPDDLKTANVIPIYKGGNRDIPKNYRPIALTSHLIKIFEKVLRRYVVKYLDKYNLLNSEQHGFRSGRSCLSQLLAHYDRILNELEKCDGVDVVYLDFAKAFDKVDFGITLQKISALGINGKIGQWIRSFLSNRSQSVIVNGVRSSNAEVKSGVPQGSVLGPVLFLIMMGDIDQEVRDSFLSSFADDTRVGHNIKSQSDEADLQDDLNRIYLFAEQNNMAFNSAKFELVRYRKPGSEIGPPPYTTPEGELITEKHDVRDLGVTMSNDGGFRDHIQNIRQKASMVSSWILRTFKSRHKDVMLTLWKTMVRPHLDYCCQVWNPTLLSDKATLEQIQKSFVYKIRGFEHLNYHERLKEFGLYSLERRRERYLIIYTWRIIEEQVPNVGINAKYSDRRGRLCVIPSVQKSAPNWVKRLKDGSFLMRGPRLFNCIPASIRKISNCHVDKFKSALDLWIAGIPDEPHVSGYTAMRRAATNSIQDMWRFRAANHGHLGC